MKKLPIVAGIVVLACLAMIAVPGQAGAKGGAGPCLASCCLGPRIGLEMNEGEKVETIELAQIVPGIGQLCHLYLAYDYGYKTAGVTGCLASCCLGPRVGQQLNERKVRTIEKLRLVPVINLYAWIATGMEAYGGKTMTEIEKAENLKK